jgi:hypothetical protein
MLLASIAEKNKELYDFERMLEEKKGNIRF